MQLGRSFNSTEPLYLKLFLQYVVVLNDGASSFFFRKLCPVSLIGLIKERKVIHLFCKRDIFLQTSAALVHYNRVWFAWYVLPLA